MLIEISTERIEPMDRLIVAFPEVSEEEKARNRAHMACVRVNSEWLQSHWGSVLPQAEGQYVAVAGQEAYIANNSEAALQLARTAHPDDVGAICHFVPVRRGKICWIF